MTQLLATASAIMGRLPLCTTPASDCVILVASRIFMTFIISVSNLSMASVLSHNIHLDLPDVGLQYSKLQKINSSK